ncbi:Hypothetical predicted protein [Xyrichtys novacula]|uniref:Uncharacterized protein n=1 Tax=Xyrichtys novacula TaxID=13765 RepID=A0AAV1HGP3_XYRNO|nr:Hypothetical predicted protein [Xyrichtys novacula]
MVASWGLGRGWRIGPMSATRVSQPDPWSVVATRGLERETGPQERLKYRTNASHQNQYTRSSGPASESRGLRRGLKDRTHASYQSQSTRSLEHGSQWGPWKRPEDRTHVSHQNQSTRSLECGGQSGPWTRLEDGSSVVWIR